MAHECVVAFDVCVGLSFEKPFRDAGAASKVVVWIGGSLQFSVGTANFENECLTHRRSRGILALLFFCLF